MTPPERCAKRIEPCPCGVMYRSTMKNLTTKEWQIKCWACGSTHDPQKTKEDAIAAWNAVAGKGREE